MLACACAVPTWALVWVPAWSPLAPADPCLVMDGRVLDEADDVPGPARDAGLTRAVATPQLVDNLDTADRQLGTATATQALDALNHYLLTDAFRSFADDPA